MSTRISSLSMRTTVPSTTSPCLKLLMSESCSASSSSIVVGSGPVARRGAGRLGLGSSSAAASARRRVVGLGRRRDSAASAAAGCVGVAGVVGRRRRRRRRRPRPRRPSRRRPRRSARGGLGAARRLGSGRLRGRGRPRRSAAAAAASDVARPAPPRARGVDRRGCGGVPRSGSAGGGLVGDGDRRDGLLGRLGIARRRSPPAPARSRPAALRSRCRVSCRWIRPENHERPEPRPGRVWRRSRWSVVTLARGPLLRARRGLRRRSSAVRASVGRESLARGFRAATIAAPCPSCPTSTSSPTRSTPPSRAGRSTAAEAPGAARRARHAGRARGARRAARRRGSAGAASSSTSTSIATGSSSTRCSPAGSSSPRPATKPPSKTAVVLGVRRRGPAAARGRRRLDDGRRLAARPTTRTVEVRYRDPTQMGKVYLLPAGVDRAVPGPGRRRDGPGRRRPGADARGLARPDPPPPGRAQEPAPQPGVRGRDRQRLQRRDPARRAAAAVPQAVDARGRGGRRAVRGDALDARRRDRRPAASASRRRSRSRSATSSRSTTRAAQPCPRCGTRITEVKAGGFVDLVLPGLPALSGDVGQRELQDLADPQRLASGRLMSLRLLSTLRRRPELARRSRSACRRDLTL